MFMIQNNVFKPLKRKISQMDLVLPGTLRTVYLKCGKLTCRCRSKKKNNKHGPYYFWDRKIAGTLTSSSISKHDISKFKRWIKNRQILEKLIQKLLHHSQQWVAKK